VLSGLLLEPRITHVHPRSSGIHRKGKILSDFSAFKTWTNVLEEWVGYLGGRVNYKSPLHSFTKIKIPSTSADCPKIRLRVLVEKRMAKTPPMKNLCYGARSSHGLAVLSGLLLARSLTHVHSRSSGIHRKGKILCDFSAFKTWTNVLEEWVGYLGGRVNYKSPLHSFPKSKFPVQVLTTRRFVSGCCEKQTSPMRTVSYEALSTHGLAVLSACLPQARPLARAKDYPRTSPQ
jgi:hypothetical protein